MIGFRVGSLWVVGLVWLAVGVGCADTADRNAKPKEVVSAVEPKIKSESESIEKLVEKYLADEPGAIVIPLDTIWGNKSGMRDLFDLEPERFSKIRDETIPNDERAKLMANSLHFEITRSLPRGWSADYKKATKPGFAVLGTGREALENMHAVIVKKRTIRQLFPEGKEISLIFFTRPTSKLHLNQVVRLGNSIQIKYHFTYPNLPRALSGAKRAIIPLGILPPGKFQVEIIGTHLERGQLGQLVRDRLNLKTPDIPMGDDMFQGLVCQSFSFTVQTREAWNEDPREPQFPTPPSEIGVRYE